MRGDGCGCGGPRGCPPTEEAAPPVAGCWLVAVRAAVRAAVLCTFTALLGGLLPAARAAWGEWLDGKWRR